MNNVPFEPKDRYFPGLPVNYGYALKNSYLNGPVHYFKNKYLSEET
jgi:hypothetical protein